MNDMREIKLSKINKLNSTINILAEDRDIETGSCIEYQIDYGYGDSDFIPIPFQNGNPEEGINGISNETLLAILIDRLQGFQTGKFSSRETAIALTHLEEALMWLEKRTRERIERGVEGKREV